MHLHFAAFAALGLCALGGCTDDSSAMDGAPADIAPVESRLDYELRVSAALCAQVFACCPGERRFPSADACARTMADAISEGAGTFGSEWVQFDVDNATVCLAHFEGARAAEGCGFDIDTAVHPACDALTRGLQGEGEVCGAIDETASGFLVPDACEDGLNCMWGDDQPTCRPPVEDGAPCGGFEDCRAGSACMFVGADKICQPKVATGEPCFESTDCEGGICDRGTCAAQRQDLCALF